jgi:glycosyltransferase involved in cell wall biosynthesis
VHQISVVVTNHNYGHFLSRCIRSLLDQSIPRELFKIIVVDDFSEDDSLEILEIFKGEIEVIPLKKNMGLAFASNAGIKNCKSRYVVRVDADDYVHPKFLEQLLLAFELIGSDYEAVSCDYFEVDVTGKVLRYGEQRVKPIACGIAFKLDAFEFLGFYNPKLRINEEVDFQERFKSAGMTVFNLSLPLYRYVQHDKSLTKRVPR